MTSTPATVTAPAPRPTTAAAPNPPSVPPRRGRRTGRLESAQPGTRLGIALSLLPGAVLFTVFYLVPLVVVVVTSLSDWGPIELTFTWTQNYRLLLTDDIFWTASRNTAVFVAAAVLVQVPVGVAAAVILARRVRGWRLLRTLFFLPNVVSYAALALVYVTFYNPRYGLLNQLLSALGFDGSRDWLFDVDTALPAVAATWLFTAGVVMILVMAEIEAIPAEIYESARVDGASVTRQFFQLTLPLLRNVVGVCLILVLLGTLAYFDGVYIMTGGGPADRTLTLSLYAFQEYSNSDWGYANAIGVVLIAAGLLGILLLRRAFRLGERDL